MANNLILFFKYILLYIVVITEDVELLTKGGLHPSQT